MNKMIASIVMIAMTVTASAQSGSNSPYSQYGLGDISLQSTGFNKGMNGVGLAMRKGNEVNPLNPASYSAIDSVTMIFDAGLSGQNTNYKENNTKKNLKSGGFDYFATLFRVSKNVGVSVGFMPYSSVGYEYELFDKEQFNSTTLGKYYLYDGEGGLNQFYAGIGIRIFKPLSIGANISYLWGDIDKNIQVSTNTSTNTLFRQYEMNISNYKLDFGLQFEQPIGSKGSAIAVGATFTPGHKLNTDAICRMIMTNASLTKADSTSFTINNALSIPTAFGVGMAYTHAAKLRLGADFNYQKWNNISYPYFDGTTFAMKENLLKDRYQVNVGAEFMTNPLSRSFWGHVRYRLGFGYTTPYYIINGKDGPKETSLSFGFGIPIANGYNNRSILNISAQWVRRSAVEMVTENTFRINIGLTFNERWFAKWKIE